MNLSKPTRLSLCAVPLAFFAMGALGHAAVSAAIAPEQKEFFENKIRPILANSCLECHSAEKGKVKGGLNMDSRESVLKGGETGPAMEPGNAAKSLLIKAVTWEDDLQMPPKKKLTSEEIAALKEWITMGAPDPREASKVAVKDKKSHWAFQPIARPTPPQVKNSAWVVNSIDKFVLAKLEEKQMLPAAQADKEALLRRAYFDLIGLPPSPRDIEAFRQDSSPDAFAKVVDRLLNDPAYGERWARHWMDTARYSDTTGVVGNDRFNDFRYAYAYSYRDWLIHSLNADMPYDQFILNQLAADKMKNNEKENLAALGFLTVGQRFNMKDDIINDRIDVIGRGLLGLTIACARCHDHKFDPVTAADYYALRGVFDSITEPKEGPIVAGDENSKSYKEFTKKLAEMEQHAYDTFYKVQRQISDDARKNAEKYFEVAFYSRRDATPEEKKIGIELVEKGKVNAREVDELVKFNPNNPIVGPFVKFATLKDDRAKILSQLGSRANPLVIEFLKKQPALPSSPHDVAVLFGKFMLEQEPKVASLYAEMSDPSKDISKSPNRAAMEIATYPLGVVGASELTLDRLRQEGLRWGLRLGGKLEGPSGLAKINEFKLTARGGPVRAMVVEDLPKPKDSPLFIRGNAPKQGEDARIIPRRFIEVLSPNQAATPFKEGSGRFELAQAIASKSNPLTARVLVNRVWMYHFGEGLVRTPDDLGNQAGTPSHPELLDYLSTWFMEDYGPTKRGWSLKSLHKAIMLSKTYQQSSNTSFRTADMDYVKMDPSNSLLWHYNVRRLDFESFRDSLLSMAGTLDRGTIGGPSVNITQEPFSMRRAVYGYVDRSNMSDLLMQFDMSNPDQPNTKRTSTIVPQQALFLMNSPFIAEIVQNVVKRPEVVEAVARNHDTTAGIVAIFRIVLQRTPTQIEKEMAMKFLVTENKFQSAVKSETAQTTAAAAKLAEAAFKRAQNNNGAKKAILNEGELVQRVTFSPWEALVQAIMFSNEAAYVN
ncbi:MAG: PSD1 and planctomycete cytochrome C domain-containing protein [Verrucomicrobiota bacterium]